ncbi:hypothetical protein JCM10450v2_000373 [Rhodotorula kratochvilovae]
MTSPEAAPSFRAWTHGSPPFPSTLSLLQQDPPKPADLKPHEILVEVHSAALNPVDVQFRNLPIFRLPALSYPHGIGCDFAGVVLGRGEEVKDLPIGTEVMGVTMNPLANANGGTLSEISVIDTTRSTVIPKPPHLSWAQAAAIPLTFLTAKTVLSAPYLVLPPSASAEPTSKASHATQPTIVVLGGSTAVGQHVVQLAAKRLHFRVVATCSAANAEFVHSLGAGTTIDYSAEDVPARLAALRPPEGFLSIIDCAGGRSVLDHAAALLSPRSRAFPAGGSFTTIVGDKTARAALGGSWLYLTHPSMLVRMLRGWAGYGFRYSCIMFRNDRGWLGEVGHLVADEGYEIVVDSEFAFEEVEQAFERLNTGRARGKVVVHVKKQE